MTQFYVGLMSGTSLDGVDAVLVDFAGTGGAALQVRGHAHRPFAPEVAAELLLLNSPGENELHRAGLAANALARSFAQTVDALLHATHISAGQVLAIGAHGQTVRHRPGEFDGIGYTLQLNNPALLAELTGINVVADFRSRDVAAGGQGAPLVPAFHRAVFARAGETVAVVNIGGISNLTVLSPKGETQGFDCGPGNALLDHWCRTHTRHPFDDAGGWASTGDVIDTLLAIMLAEPYFSLAAPKSTGRDLFNPAWLAARLSQMSQSAALRPQDVQATLSELTARVCSDAVLRNALAARELLVCGGGAFNADLMRRLAARMPGTTVLPTDARGLPAHQVEACAFAWLAREFHDRRSGNLSEVTGARGPRVLGALYPSQ